MTYAHFTPPATSLFGPLSKKYCEVFYYLSIFQFFWLVIGIISVIYLLSDLKKNKPLIMSSVFMSVNAGFMYFMSRLFYGMCIK